jgi:hypothetical protein
MVGNAFEKELTELEQYKVDTDELLLMADSPKDEFTKLMVEYVQSAGDVNQVNLSSYRSGNGVGIDGWSYSGDEDMSTVDLFLTLYVDPDKSQTIPASDLDRHFGWLQRFYEQSKSGSIFTKIQDDKSDLYQVAQLIRETTINRIRLFILTNAIMPSTYDKQSSELEDGTLVEYYVWDVKRMMQQDHIRSGRNPIVVDFEGDYNCTLPCIQMPDVSEHVMCYLCIIPGMILSQVYHKYHQQILEMNVRTFLQFKGASNKGIRDTLIGHKASTLELRKGITDSEAEPDMFFAYNNGISATASEVRLNEEGNAISRIKSWQIVNGGQTTAAISAVMAMKDVDVNKLAQVYVPMKITVIKDKDNLSVIVPKISKYANTQSAVKKSDFNINEKFLVELEQCSREEWVLNANGKPVSKWFFERTRGQYLDKAKRLPGLKAEREFYAEYPKGQMFDKALLSKCMVAWDQNPASVCKGGENNYAVFFEKSKRAGIHFDKTRFRRAIAKLILFKALDALYGKDGIQLPGYKANMIAYTISLISHVTSRALNLDTVWQEQNVLSPNVYNELSIDIFSIYAKLICGAEHITYKVKETYTDIDGRKKNRYTAKELPAAELKAIKGTALYKILEYAKKVEPILYKHLVMVNEGENVGEWTKKPQCWEALKVLVGRQEGQFKFPQELCSSTGDLDVEVTEGQKKYIDEALLVDAETWFSINSWSKDNPGLLSPKEQAFIGQIGFRVKRSYSLSYKQAKWALDILEKARDLGWIG